MSTHDPLESYTRDLRERMVPEGASDRMVTHLTTLPPSPRRALWRSPLWRAAAWLVAGLALAGRVAALLVFLGT